MDKKIIVFVLTICATLITGTKFRFDYEYTSEADGWLKMHVVPATWSEARLRCHAEGAVLASPLTWRLRDAILNFALKRLPNTIYSGVHATLSKGDYVSVEGVPLSRLAINWAPGEPDNYENSESCLVMVIGKNGTMADVRCTYVFPYVCYKKRAALVMTGCGTTDPEYTLSAATGSCYKFHVRGLTWSQAHMACIAEGGHLAIINSDQESTILKELYAKYPDKEIFSKNPHIASIGFLEWRDGGSWMTIHGETLPEAGFNKWWEGGPDNYTRAPLFSSELCGSMVRSGVVNDVACDLTLPFICEKKPESLEDPDDIF